MGVSGLADLDRREDAGTIGTAGFRGGEHFKLFVTTLSCSSNDFRCVGVAGCEVLGLDGRESLRILSTAVASRAVVGPGSDGRLSGHGAFFATGFSSSLIA